MSKKSSPLVSVIIPIYNVEKYLTECLDSVLGQTYHNLEIICVNDGSPDGSLSICEEYAQKDNRIKIISKENGGLNMARKTGFENSTGEWITFVDSDDVVSESYVEILYKATQEYDVDIAIGGFETFTENLPQTKTNNKFAIIASDDAKRRYLVDDRPGDSIFWQTAWGKIFSRDIIENINWAVSNYRCNEDEAMSIFFYANNINGAAIAYDNIYFYRQNPESIMSKLKDRYINFYQGKEINRFTFWHGIYQARAKYFGEGFVAENSYFYSLQFIIYLKSQYDLGRDFKIPEENIEQYNSNLTKFIESEKKIPYYDLFVDIFKSIKKSKSIAGFYGWAEKNPLISVVIPVYNVEKYLPECLESVLRQTYRNIEIILIDDGSTDKSGKICQEYVDKYSQFKYIQQPNGGVSMARNRGMEVANGEYIMFVDSDDFLQNDAVENLVGYISEDVDVISGKLSSYHSVGYDIVNENRNVKYDDSFILRESSENIIVSMLTDENSPCGKLFRRKLVTDNKLEFPQDLKIAEDLVFVAKALFLAKSIVLSDEVIYNYRQDFDNNHSAIGKIDESKAFDFYKSLQEIRQFLKSQKLLEKKTIRDSFKQVVLIHSLFNLEISEKDHEVHKMVFDKINSEILEEFDISRDETVSQNPISEFIYTGDYDKYLIYRLSDLKQYTLNRVDAVGYLENQLKESNEKVAELQSVIEDLNSEMGQKRSVLRAIRTPLSRIKRFTKKIISRVKF